MKYMKKQMLNNFIQNYWLMNVWYIFYAELFKIPSHIPIKINHITVSFKTNRRILQKIQIIRNTILGRAPHDQGSLGTHSPVRGKAMPSG